MLNILDSLFCFYFFRMDDDLSGVSSDESDEEAQNSNSVGSSVSESDGSKNEDEEPLKKLPRIAESSNGISVAPS